MAKGKTIYKRKLALIFLVFLFFLIFSFSTFFLIFWNRFYPNTYLLNYPLEGKTKQQALIQLRSLNLRPSEIILNYQEKRFNFPTSDIFVSYDIEKSLNDAFFSSRSMTGIFGIKKFYLKYSLRAEKFDSYVNDLSDKLTIPETYPRVSLTDGKININRGTKGTRIDKEKLKQEIESAFSNFRFDPIEIPVRVIDPTINDFRVAVFSARAGKLLDKRLRLKTDDHSYDIDPPTILSFLAPDYNYYDSEIGKIITKIGSDINQDASDAKFVFNQETGRVGEFSPSRDGVKIDSENLSRQMKAALKELENTDLAEKTIDVPTIKTRPKLATTDVNNLGIKELLGIGTSKFAGSIPSRVHNVVLAASRINGILIAPGEIFSFNNSLGDVSKYTGYQEAYIIKDGKTILGDGGGVCQVSTTLFRAVMNAGLPVNERAAHAYRVFYYEEDSPVGLDATVYSPSPDFKFTNDTPNYILIQATADIKNYFLRFEIYGTSDGRTSIVGKPVILETTPPPPDEYTDDPTLPVGQIKQVDHSAWGAKVKFDYKVTRNGETIYQKTFLSIYQPWSNKFIRGTKQV
jgi:vancomycin resistance protein YoaR